MDTVQVGLLLKDAAVNSPTSNKTIIVTANGHVGFTNGFNMATGMRFTLEQWNEIVEFVDGQLLQEFEGKQPSWGPDWSKIDAQYLYYAVDDNGSAYVYVAKPYTCADGVWLPNGDNYIELNYVKLPHGLSWTQSLVERPGIVSPKC